MKEPDLQNTATTSAAAVRNAINVLNVMQEIIFKIFNQPQFSGKKFLNY